MPLARVVKQRSRQGYTSLTDGMRHVRSYRWCLQEDVWFLVLLCGDRRGTTLQMWLPDKEGKGDPRRRHDAVVRQLLVPSEREHPHQTRKEVVDDREASVRPSLWERLKTSLQTEHLDLEAAFGNVVSKGARPCSLRQGRPHRDRFSTYLRARYQPFCLGFDCFHHFSRHWRPLLIVLAFDLPPCLWHFQICGRLSTNF